ncbi:MULTISPECIES: hypothetical protein [unclassified Arthrobacter]|uniref:hypothetical protein n=1 Tax=unclassified Arthrobacter TaxID=235627 RepID=UPI002E01952B|nr:MULTISPECIES: hypothetical protein [unclassified Arthrobacter]MEC5191353.1 hypothetical protein [Arthrobacter sp. MP_M4]MEC5202896.1 hypothetical protein [Arthrobacter sp. MP_M7]
MPWWSWIVIWIALVALSLLFFLVLGVRLFRNFMATVKELGAAEERFSTLPSPGAELESQAGRGTEQEPGSAVFASPVQMGHDYRAGKSARQENRRQRRVQRKRGRGQPQRLNDIEIS